MHGKQFFIWASYTLAKAKGVTGASGKLKACATIINGHAYLAACRPICYRFFAVITPKDWRSNSLVARPRFAPRKRVSLYAQPDSLWDQPSNFAGPCQPSARCALGDGRGRSLCRAVCGRGRNLWCACGFGFYGHQTLGYAGRGVWRAAVSSTQRRSRRLKCGAGTLAGLVVAVQATPARQQIPWRAKMGRGFIPRPWTHAGQMGCTI